MRHHAESITHHDLEQRITMVVDFLTDLMEEGGVSVKNSLRGERKISMV
jgi:hypothetical protein